MTVVDASELTTAQRLALIEADWLTVDAGLELLDADDNLIEDITDDFIAAGSSVIRGIYNTIHGQARLSIARELQWGWQRLRPYLLLSADGVTFHRFELGIFLPSTPAREVAESPQVFTVDCMDKLDVLNTPHGAYSLASGEPVIAAVEALITGAGESKINIDQTAAATVAGSVRSFPISDSLTTLQICNDLLDYVGYRSLYVDRSGTFRSEPYVSPENLPTMWRYDASSDTTTVGESRTITADFYRAANEVQGYNDDPGEVTTIPVEGAGKKTLQNQSNGDTSIDGRGGRTIRRIISGSYSSQAALESAVQRVMDAEMRVNQYVDLLVSPNPVHGHYDVVSYIDPAASVSGRFIVSRWELPLDGSDMRLEMRAV